MASLKKSERYRQAILSGDKAEAERIKEEINADVRARYLPKPPQHVSNTILSDDNANALSIYKFLNDKYGEQWWDWEIETLETMLMRDYGQVVTDINADKIQALKLLCNNQLPFTDWYYFNQICVALAGAVADFQDMKYPTPGMVVAGLRVMRAVRPEEEFGAEVKKFAALLLKSEGVYVPPPTVFDILKESFDVSDSMKSKWAKVMVVMGEMLAAKDYENGSDDVVDIQARRLINVENAAEKYGG